jgi:hypothetical protein
MAEPSKMPRYNIRNDGIGPYAAFLCDLCGREYRSQPDVTATITKDIGRQAMGGFLRNIPLVGNAVANNVVGEDPRYSYNLTPQQLNNAWNQVKQYFRECPTCHQVICVSDFDEVAGFCKEDSPRRNQIAEAEGQQAGNMVKGLAAAFGIDQAIKQAGEAARTASSQMARCPNDGHLAPAGTKFCPECGSPMVQPVAAAVCPKCGQPALGSKFCSNCGAKIEVAPVAVDNCPQCGAAVKGAKFCPECGTKVG